MKKKVLFLIECMSIGGAEKVLIDLVNNLNKDIYDVTVIKIYKKNIYNQNAKFAAEFNENVTVRYLCNNEKSFMYKLFNFALSRIDNKLIHKFLIGMKYDIEIAYYEGLPTKLISNSMNKKSKKIAWIHTDSKNRTKEFDSQLLLKEKEIYSKYDKVIGVSEDVVKSFKDVFDNIDNVEVKYNPIDSNYIKSKGNEEIELNKEDDCITLVTIGRLTPIKGYDRLINVLSRLKKDNFKFKLWIVGNGECREDLEKQVSELGLNNEVIFVGFQENPYKYLRKSDLYVCSSWVEGYSTVVLEAICAEVPVITTECPGMREIFGNYECGKICDNNEDSLYNEMKSILNKKEILEYYKKKCMERSKEFNITNTIKEIETIFE